MDPFTWLLKQFQEYEETQVHIGKKKITAEIADTPEKRMIGLMYRKNLGTDKGMVLVFDDDDKYCIWMQNMNFPIDVVWVNSANKVVHLEENVPPAKKLFGSKTYCPDKPAIHVIEVPSGFVKKNKIKKGSIVKFAKP